MPISITWNHVNGKDNVEIVVFAMLLLKRFHLLVSMVVERSMNTWIVSVHF